MSEDYILKNGSKVKYPQIIHKPYLFLTGLKYNYPVCCIIQFIKDFYDYETKEQLLRQQLVIDKKSLYVPCKNCYKKYFEGGIINEKN